MGWKLELEEVKPYTRESTHATHGEASEDAMGETEASTAHTQQAGEEGPEEASAENRTAVRVARGWEAADRTAEPRAGGAPDTRTQPAEPTARAERGGQAAEDGASSSMRHTHTKQPQTCSSVRWPRAQWNAPEAVHDEQLATTRKCHGGHQNR